MNSSKSMPRRDVPAIVSKGEPSLLEVGGQVVKPGQRCRLEVPIARIATGTLLSLPITVVRGLRDGPRLWLSGAIHGDELNGMEIIRRVLEHVEPHTLRGAVLAVPIVNVFGFIDQSRYLPDRRDLNRCFPGSLRGSLASRLAHLFMSEIVDRCTHGIDLHTAALHRINLAQIRANLADPETRRCAEAFGAPVMIHTGTRDGSLREAATRRGVAVLVYEAGEPLRFNHDAIELGVSGILRVMASLNMCADPPLKAASRTVEAHKSTWVRARRSGILRLQVSLGQWVKKRETLGVISDAFGEEDEAFRASCSGLVIGHTNNPLVTQGDGIVHLAEAASTAEKS